MPRNGKLINRPWQVMLIIMIKNFINVPSSIDQDINKDYTTWCNGKYISIDEGMYLTVFIAHFIESKDENDIDIVRAYPIRVDKPVTRDKLINAAEMQAYGLLSAMDVASFTASLARKSRENEDSEELREHDDFINWVKVELSNIGIV